MSRAEAEQFVDSVEAGMAEEYRLAITSRELGEIVLEKLRDLDPVAYVRFASVYRQFENAEQFVSELHNIRKGGSRVRSGT